MIEGYFNGSITRIRQVKDDYGRVSELQLLMDARVENETKSILNANGQLVQANYFIMLSPNADIDPTDRIVIGPIETGTTQKRWVVLKVFKAGGFEPTHTEVYL